MDHLNKALGIVLATVLVTGCSSSQEAASKGTDPSPPPAASVSTTQEPSPSEEPTPTVEPATGPTAKVKGMRINLPAGWTAGSGSALADGGYTTDAIGTMINLFRFPQLSYTSLDEAVRTDARGGGGYWDSKPKRLDNVIVEGYEVAHLSGKASGGGVLELYSTLVNDQSLELKFIFRNQESKAERDEIVESVLASWKFTH